ncbi:glycosyltransferase [Thermospira aquatica]|uniref:Glycosyltransferase n=1 Tax=Thermospira aquatica TaxID=2828656 RepID=A0AAX3BF32_9SPIR|nr:glycosyltransferase [Thermospira aquatica]URA10743.1 glycosyltransferase [Thermospira aquatica]
MNIALFLDCFTPMKNGVITSALQLKEGLEKKGHHVCIVSVLVKGYENKDPDVLLIPQLELDFGSKQGFGAALVNNKKVINFLKEHKVELIHSHTEFMVGLAAKHAARKLGIPRISTTHTMWEMYSNYSFILGMKSIWRTYFRFYMKGTSVIVAPSIKAKKYDNLVVPEIPVQIIPNGIDMVKFKQKPMTQEELHDLRKRYSLSPEDKILIFVGRIGPEKRVIELYHAMEPVMKKHKNVKMVFVGDGPAHEELQKRANDLGLAGQTVFTGFVDWKEVYRLYSIANLFVTASLSEVHPMTLIEAAICGVPSVARRDDSYLDLIEEGKNGYMADTDEAMTAIVEDLITDEKKLKLFSEEALRISSKFSAENHVNRMEKLYKKVLELYPDNLNELWDEHLLDK